MTQVWLYASFAPQGRGEATVRADLISAIYEIRDPHMQPASGKPWRIEATVVGLPHPVVLATAPDPGPKDDPFEGGVSELRDAIIREVERVQPQIQMSLGSVNPLVGESGPAIAWDRYSADGKPVEG